MPVDREAMTQHDKVWDPFTEKHWCVCEQWTADSVESFEDHACSTPPTEPAAINLGLGVMDNRVKRIAEALYLSEQLPKPWDEIGPVDQRRYYKLAHVAIEAMELRQEWAANESKWLNPSLPRETREQAQHLIDEMLAKWERTDGQVSGGAITKPDAFVVSRFITDWERDDG